MPTRMYLANLASPVSPAIDAAWNVGGGSAALRLGTSKNGTALNDHTNSAVGTGNENVFCAQFISDQLAAQTISGTVKGQAWCREGSSTMDAMSQVVIRVVSGDGTIVRGTLLAAHSEALSSEWGAGAGARNRKFPLAALSPATVTNVVAQAGDRIVVELGARVTAAVAGEVRVRARDDQAGDLPEDETTNDTADPWVEFSAGLTFQAAPSGAPPSGGLTPGISFSL